MSDRLSFRQLAAKSVFKGKVNSGLDRLGQKFPAAGKLKDNPTFQKGLDSFSDSFARSPDATRNPKAAIGDATAREIGKGLGYLNNKIDEGISAGIKKGVGFLTGGKQ